MKKLIILLFISLSSCSQQSDPKQYLIRIGITLADEYEIIENNTSFAIGESLVEFKIRVSDKDYSNIVKRIERLKGYTEIEGDKLPLSNKGGVMDEASIVGWKWKRNNVYFYEFSQPHSDGTGVEDYLVYLSPNNVLEFQYAEE